MDCLPCCQWCWLKFGPCRAWCPTSSSFWPRRRWVQVSISSFSNPYPTVYFIKPYEDSELPNKNIFIFSFKIFLIIYLNLINNTTEALRDKKKLYYYSRGKHIRKRKCLVTRKKTGLEKSTRLMRRVLTCWLCFRIVLFKFQ